MFHKHETSNMSLMKVAMPSTLSIFSLFAFTHIYSNEFLSDKESFLKSRSNLSKINLSTDYGEMYFIRKQDVFKSDSFKDGIERNSKVREAVTLVTQCSVENLHFVDSLSDRWNGPISVAVFIDSNDERKLRQVQYYHQCYKNIRANTTFHLMYPEAMSLRLTRIDCEKFRANLKETPLYMRSVKGMRYPYNMMRNLAIPRGGNGYIFLIDIDMVPSPNLHDEFLKYSKTLDTQILESSIFIVPTFESKHQDNLPGNKIELVQGTVNREIRPFYSKACWKCQFNTNYRKWKYIKTKSMSTYEIESKFYNYEPYYIVRADRFIPYDERFVGRGYDRISQVSEVWMAGFKFRVLTDGFLIHRGFHVLDKPRDAKCPMRKRKEDENKCVIKQDKKIFLQILFEIDEKRHFNRKTKERLRTMNEEDKAWISLKDPNRELYWGFVEELERKYIGTNRRISHEWYLTEEGKAHEGQTV